MKKTFKQDKGQAGLTILLSVVVTLFVIGLLVMIFALMSGEIQDQDLIYERTGTQTTTGEAVTQALMGSATGDPLAADSYRSAQCTIVQVYNATVTGVKIGSGNYTEVSECHFKNSTNEFLVNDWAVNYTYTYLADQYGTAEIINDTTSALKGTTDWFDIFIVITAMVVLILLTVIIIGAIRQSGLVDSGGRGVSKIGTA